MGEDLLSQDYARRMDAEDTLGSFREQFYLTPGQIYLDGNSLGLLSRGTEQAVLKVLQDWKALGIAGWTEADPAWYTLAEEVGRLTAPLIGAEPEEVVAANSTTVNLHQLLATLFRPIGPRTKILADELNFPSDIYALHSHLQLHGLDPETHLSMVKSRDGRTLAESDIIDAMSDEIQMVVLPSVLYRSGQLLDMPRLTKTAHQKGLLIGFDCSHSIGAVPHRLSEWGVDFAFWCSYKYLNSGPGATGGLYLNRRHFGCIPGLAGWFSSEKTRQFAMRTELEPSTGAGALQIGTPNILSLAPTLSALQTVLKAGMKELRAKSLRLTQYLIALADAELSRFGFEVATPREEARRGGHIAFAHLEAPRICKALRQQGVTPDFRPPDIVRLAPVPLYTRFVDCHEAIQRLVDIMDQRQYLRYSTDRDLVT